MYTILTDFNKILSPWPVEKQNLEKLTVHKEGYYEIGATNFIKPAILFNKNKEKKHESKMK